MPVERVCGHIRICGVIIHDWVTRNSKALWFLDVDSFLRVSCRKAFSTSNYRRGQCLVTAREKTTYMVVDLTMGLKVS